MFCCHFSASHPEHFQTESKADITIVYGEHIFIEFLSKHQTSTKKNPKCYYSAHHQITGASHNLPYAALPMIMK